MFYSILSLVAGLAILVAGAEALVRGSVGAALRFGLTPLLIGLTVVAFGTSSPELVVSIKAGLDGNGDIALGNIIGSNICNIALILGLSALIQPLKVQATIIRKDVPVLVAVSLLLLVFLMDGTVSFWEGLIFVVGLVAFTVFSIRQAKREAAAVKEEFTDVVPAKKLPLWMDLTFLAAGLGLLVLGAQMLVDSAVEIALTAGMSQAAIGLTIVAVGTSLPELATSVIAAFKKEGDIAIGNVVGSNLFNMLGILGLTALVLPVAQGGITTIDTLLMLGLTLFLLPVLRSGYTVSRVEGGLFVAIYVAYTVYLLGLSS